MKPAGPIVRGARPLVRGLLAAVNLALWAVVFTEPSVPPLAVAVALAELAGGMVLERLDREPGEAHRPRIAGVTFVAWRILLGLGALAMMTAAVHRVLPVGSAAWLVFAFGAACCVVRLLLDGWEACEGDAP